MSARNLAIHNLKREDNGSRSKTSKSVSRGKSAVLSSLRSVTTAGGTTGGAGFEKAYSSCSCSHCPSTVQENHVQEIVWVWMEYMLKLAYMKRLGAVKGNTLMHR